MTACSRHVALHPLWDTYFKSIFECLKPHLGVDLRVGVQPLDPLDDSNSLSDLARSMHHTQPSSAQSATADSSSVQHAAHGPLVQLMQSITKATASSESAATAEGSTTDLRVDNGNGGVGLDEAVNHAAGVSLALPRELDEEAALDSPHSTAEGASLQHPTGKTLPQHHALGHVSAGDEVSELDGSWQSRQDDIAICSAQDFFKGQG